MSIHVCSSPTHPREAYSHEGYHSGGVCMSATTKLYLSHVRPSWAHQFIERAEVIVSRSSIAAGKSCANDRRQLFPSIPGDVLVVLQRVSSPWSFWTSLGFFSVGNQQRPTSRSTCWHVWKVSRKDIAKRIPYVAVKYSLLTCSSHVRKKYSHAFTLRSACILSRNRPICTCDVYI